MKRARVCCTVVAALAVFGVGCEKEPVKPKRTEPWLAQPSVSVGAGAGSVAAPIRYEIVRDSKVTFELPAREANPKGIARVVRGELVLHTLDLPKTTATVEVDLGSIQMDGEDAGAESAASSERALSWLDIGSSRPEAERERLRWAKFELTSIEDLFSSAANAGKRIPLSALGQLSLHGFRVPTRAALELEFLDADADREPSEVVIRTRRPFVVSLSTHDIQPRDSSGVLLAQETKLLGVRVGREARVSLELHARRPLAQAGTRTQNPPANPSGSPP